MNDRKKLQLGGFLITPLWVIGLTIAINLFFVPNTESATPSVKMVPENFTGLAELVSPAVVNIRTVKTIKGGGRVFRHFRGPFDKDDPMREFFEKFFGPEQQRDFKQRSLGSGFIIDQKDQALVPELMSKFDGNIWVLKADTWMGNLGDRIRLAGEVIIFGNQLIKEV